MKNSRKQLWLIPLMLLLNQFSGCEGQNDHSILIGAQADYDVKYTLFTEQGSLSRCFVELGLDQNELLAVGHVVCPWSGVHNLGSGSEARLRVWGHSGAENIQMELRINGVLVVTDVLHAGDSMIELDFNLP